MIFEQSLPYLFSGFGIGIGIIIACIACYAAGQHFAYRAFRNTLLDEDAAIRRHEGLPPRKKPKG